MLYLMALLIGTSAGAVQDSAPLSPVTTLAVPPKPAARQDGSIGGSPYPSEAVRLHQEGTTVLTVHVSAKGKVTECSVAESSGAPSLDSASCAFVRRVHFSPGLDSDGRAIEADTRFPMHWHLPKG